MKLDPKLALGYQYLGFAEYQDGQKAEALADFTRAIELDPKNALTRYLRAYLASTQAGRSGTTSNWKRICARPSLPVRILRRLTACWESTLRCRARNFRRRWRSQIRP